MATLKTALTKDQWFEKLKGWVPSWVFERDELARAHFMAMAKVLSDAQQEMYNHQYESFISAASGDVVDLHGDERNVKRLSGELDPSYSVRIRNIVNSSNCPAIQMIIDALVISPTLPIIVEDFEAAVFYDRDCFFNRQQLFLTEIIKDAFTILMPRQIHDPYSFMDREHFANREDFIGTSESLVEVFERIIEAVNRAKAAGVLYRVVELLEAS